MAERLHPGVYVEEVSSGIRPIEGVSTSTAAFVGEAARGIPGMAHFLTSYDDFERALGGHLPDERGFLAEAVQAFFDLGGVRAYAVRVLPDNANFGQTAAVSTVYDATYGPQPQALYFRAKGAGKWADALRIDIADSTHFPGEAFKVTVNWVEGGASKHLETYDDVRMDPDSEDYFLDVINRTSNYIQAADQFGADVTAAVKPWYPIVEQGPVLSPGAPALKGSAHVYTVYKDAVLNVQWWDGTPAADATPVAVTFSQAAVTHALATLVRTNKTFDAQGKVDLTPVELAKVIEEAPGANFQIDVDPADDKAPQIRADVATRAYSIIKPNSGPSYDFKTTLDKITLHATPASGPGAKAYDVFGTAGATTVAAASDNQQLPQAVITVASTAGFAAAGTLKIGTDTVTYTAKTSTTFTGCTTAGSSTLHTGDVVKQATPASLLTAADVVQALNTAVDADNPFNLSFEAIQGNVVVRSGRIPAGLALTVTASAGVTVPLTSAVDGRSGAVVESLNGVQISIADKRQALVKPLLRSLGFNTRSRGYDENSSANPLVLPVHQTNLLVGNGDDGSGTLSVSDYVGDAGSRTGLHALDTHDVNLVSIPGQWTPEFVNAGVAYCDGRHDCFFIADGPGMVHGDFEMRADEARDFVQALPNRSNNAAMYFPWIKVPDPVGVGRNPTRWAPPSGFVAGIYARTDINRGVWKAPAGLESTVNGALALQTKILDAGQDLLNPIGLNCLRQFPNTGIIVWGARTLASDPEWRYVPVRRMALFLRASLLNGLKWAVFEPNDQNLWDQIRINISQFMLGLFRQGAFQGATPAEAFLVRCDRSTNPQERVDAGIVTAQVAFAPLKPAEFVVIELSQKSLVGG